jgi:hypothetical protein
MIFHNEKGGCHEICNLQYTIFGGMKHPELAAILMVKTTRPGFSLTHSRHSHGEGRVTWPWAMALTGTSFFHAENSDK